MSWQEVRDRDEWNKFLESQNGSFLQSWEFGELQKNLGKKVWYLGVFEGKLKGVCLIFKQKSKTGTYLYSPGGPIVSDKQALANLINIITQIG
jgi:lipid II:glycine glycyltransferase (peptidoglycan interpeptide bridge formation enzyme)